MRIALGIEYNGSGFCGWQRQPSGCSVQDAVTAAVAQVAGHSVEITAAGRTDAGVHAAQQVAHFDTDAQRPLSAWVRGSNTFLPDGVAVLWAQPVEDEFHARFSALSRSYRYVLLNDGVRTAAHTGVVGWYHLPLDVAAMQRAAQQLVGEHDFSSFRGADCQAPTPVRTLMQADIRTYGRLIEFYFRANGFLHHMVRNMVGSLVQVGSGKQSVAWLADVLRARERRVAAATFSAAGLYLCEIEYDAKWRIPSVQGRIPWLQTFASPNHD